MKQQERIRLLLSIQEHPENYTVEQINQMLADDPELAELMEQLAMTKRAFTKQEVDKEDIPMDDLWEQFAALHAEEFDDHESPKEESANHPTLVSQWRKNAAVFIGVILIAGIAFAAIHFVRLTSTPKERTAQTEHPVSSTPSKILPKDTVRMDTITAQKAPMEPVVFDNIRLDDLLPQIAAYYHAEVTFQNDETRKLRFFFVWKREDGLEHAIEKLNRFESLSLRLDGNMIIVE